MHGILCPCFPGVLLPVQSSMNLLPQAFSFSLVGVHVEDWGQDIALEHFDQP